MTRRLLPVLLLLTVLAAPAAARADEVTDAKAHFRKGAELYRARQYREAIAEFEEAYRLKPAGAIHYNVAQCREKLGEWPAAIRSYNDYLREAPDANDRAVVRAAVKKLEERLAATGAQPLLVYSDPPGAEVRIDGRVRGVTPFHLVLPPGSYDVALALAGHERVEQEISMSARAAQVLEVQLRPASPAPVAQPAPAPPAAAPGEQAKPDLALRAVSPRTGKGDATAALTAAPTAPREKRRVYTWIAAGTAVVAAAAGGYYGLSARKAESALKSGYDGPKDASDATSRARRANVLYAVAGSAALAGGTLFFVEKKF